MKKYFSIILSAVIAITCLIPFTAFAEDNTEYDAEITQTEFESLEHIYVVSIQPYSSGLITSHRLGIAKNSNNLVIIGFTQGNDEVIKCGFTKVVIQRRTSSCVSWSNYKAFNDLYSDSCYYKILKTVPVEKAYQYRVTATHYSKKIIVFYSKN